MKNELKSIIGKYGEDILLNNKKFISLFADTAPSLKKEKKLLEMALTEDIGPLFVNCEKSQRSTSIIKARRKLENNYMAENGIDEVLAGITYALGWTEEYNTITNEKKTDKQTVAKSEETKKAESPKKATINAMPTKKEEMVSKPPDTVEEKKTNWLVATVLSIICGFAVMIMEGRKSFECNLYNFISGIMMVFFGFIAMHIAKKMNKGKGTTWIIAFVIWFAFLGLVIIIEDHVQLWDYLLENYEKV